MTYLQNPDGTIIGVVDIQSLTVTLTDRSGTITTGGTSQQLAPANPVRRGLRIMNVSAGDLWVNDKGGAATASQPSFKIPTNTLYEAPSNGVPGSALSIFGATTGQAYEASEW